MTQQDEQAQLQKLGRLYLERQQQSLRLLEKIDQLEAAIAATNEIALRSRFDRENATVRRKFAEHLGDQAYVEPSSSRTVMPIWRVTRVPSKKHKAAAREWMKQRCLDWDGSAPALRHAVRKALEQNQPVPEGKFGLRVERTVDIRMPRAFTINLLGKSHHVVASANQKTHVEAMEEKAWHNFFHGENYPYRDDVFDDD
jgi:hypothetical protein